MFCLILKECFENDVLNFVIQYIENYISKVLKNIQAAYSKGKEKGIKMGLLTLKVPKIANSIIAYMCSIKVRFKCFIFYKYYSKLCLLIYISIMVKEITILLQNYIQLIKSLIYAHYNLNTNNYHC